MKMEITGKKSAPILTVVIPCWNGEKYLSEMLDSIQQQSFSDWRCIIVDDQSTDCSTDIIQKFKEKDSRFILKIRDREPKGAQTCRNIGFELSEGSKYVIFFDCDDIIAPYCFEQRVAYMECNESLDFAVFPARVFHESIEEKSREVFGIKWAENDLEAFWLGMLPFVVWNNIYNRESLIRNSITWWENILSMQDRAFNMLTIIKGLKYKYATPAKEDYYWRVAANSNSLTTQVNVKTDHLHSHLTFMETLYHLMSEKQKKECENAIEMIKILFVRRFKEKIKSEIPILRKIGNNNFNNIKLYIYMYLRDNKIINYILFPQLSDYYKKMYLRKRNTLSAL